MKIRNQGIIFSVIIVTKNEEQYIEALLKAILNQDFPKGNYEILVIDGHSTDATKEIIKQIMDENPDRIRLYNNDKETLPAGWNIGIKHSLGSYVLRLDGHSMIEQDFLSRNYDVISEKSDVACIGGKVESKGHGFWGKVNAFVYSSPFGVGNSKFRTLNSAWEGYVDTVPYGAYKKEIFEQVGFFDENLKRNEDLEMHARIRNIGGQFYLNSSIRSTYYVRSTLKALVRKSFNDGKWTMIARRKSNGVLRVRHYAPLIAFSLGMLLLLMSFVTAYSLYILATLTLLYSMMLVTSSIKISKTHKGLRYILGAMLSFASLHVSRGWGSLIGLLSIKK